MLGPFSTIKTNVKRDDGTDFYWHLVSNNPFNLIFNCSISILTTLQPQMKFSEKYNYVLVLLSLKI